MKYLVSLSFGLAFAAVPAAAEKWYGALVNAASGASLPAAFELIDDKTLSYCFNDVEENCFDLPYALLSGGVIEARHSTQRKTSTGEDITQINIWTWTPNADGYRGRFAIQTGDAAPQVQTEGDFKR